MSQGEKYGIKAVLFVLSASAPLAKMPSFTNSKVASTVNMISMSSMHRVVVNVVNLLLVSPIS